MQISYNCKFCGLPGSAEAGEGASMFDVERWRTILACNRCADYRVSTRTLCDKIHTTCAFLLFGRNGRPEVKSEDKFRVKLTDLTKQLATVACKHRWIQNIWDVAFVDMLIEKPDCCRIVTGKYLRDIEKMPTGRKH